MSKEDCSSVAESAGSASGATETHNSAGWVSACCEGEYCFCGAPAARKVVEELFDDDPTARFHFGGRLAARRHPLTSYVCFPHFVEIMGSYALQIDAIASLVGQAKAEGRS